MKFQGIDINAAVLSKYNDEQLTAWLKDNNIDEKQLPALKKALGSEAKPKATEQTN